VNDAFTAHGYATPTQHAYPGGSHDARVESIVAEYRLSGRMVWGFYVTYPVPNWYQLKAAQLKKSTSWNRIKGWIDDTIADQGLLTILTHDVSERPTVWGTTPKLLGQTLDYLVQKRDAGLLQICTMAEAYDIWSTATTNPLPTAVVSFDDANESDFTRVYPMFQARGIKGTSFITTSFIDQPGSLTWAEIAQMRAGT
jgi:peptidoglycan/xylan/chitin deacetylase (PgdA/CDA1 family)